MRFTFRTDMPQPDPSLPRSDTHGSSPATGLPASERGVDQASAALPAVDGGRPASARVASFIAAARARYVTEQGVYGRADKARSVTRYASLQGGNADATEPGIRRGEKNKRAGRFASG